MTDRVGINSKEIKTRFFGLLSFAIVTVVFLLVATPALAAPPPTFGPATNYPVEQTPIDVTSADFDGDGDLDLATANRFGGGNDDVTAFENNGSGTYDSGTDFLGGTSAWAIDTGDFNEDGKPDIVLTDPDSAPNSVVVLLNETSVSGDFKFKTLEPVSSGGDFPTDVAVGDFDGDGDDDLAVANVSSDDVTILTSNGDGTFAQGQVLERPSGSSPQGVDAGDIDGNGDDDLAVANAGNDTVSIYLGGSGATFVNSQNVTVETEPGQVIIADFNNDGKGDFAASNFGSDDVSVALGNGNGTFGTSQPFTAGDGPYDLVVADYNRDNKLDIAVENYNSNNVSVLTGRGDGTFDTPANNAVGTGPFGITTGNFDKQSGVNRAGPDLATANFNSDNVSVLLNFTPPQADLSITKKAIFDPGPEPTVGQNITYRLRVTNGGADSATNVVITDTLPEGVEFVSADTGCEEKVDGTVTCEVDTLASGDSVTRKIVVRVTSAETLKNTATVESDTADPDPGNNEDTDETTSVTQGEACARSTSIKGNDSSNALRGTTGPDVICGFGGNDSIDGGGGNDVIFGGFGRDTIKGSGGQDNVFGEAAVDTIDARDGVQNEYVDGGAGSDVCRADAGDEKVNCP